MQQNLGIPVLSGGFCLVNEEARAQALPPVCLCCAALQCFWKHVCGGAAAVAVLQPGAVPAGLECSNGKYTLLYQL